MIKFFAEQLSHRLQQNSELCYFLTVGSDAYLQFTCKTEIQSYCSNQGFSEHKTFTIDNQTDWEAIFDSCVELSLFSSRTLLILLCNDNGLTTTANNKLNELVDILHQDIALLLALPKLTKSQENSHWYKTLVDNLAIVQCNTPDTKQLPVWVSQHSQKLGLTIEKAAIERLCYYYEGNLLALTQIMEQLRILYPSSQVTYNDLENHINDLAIFTPYHWIDAILLKKHKRASHILQQLKLNEFEPLILVRTLQKELILLIDLKKQSQTSPLKMVYDTLRVWQNRRNILTPYLSQITIAKLYQGLQQLTDLEINLKSDYQFPVWAKLFSLTLLLTESSHD